jgi:hypothetical protein
MKTNLLVIAAGLLLGLIPLFTALSALRDWIMLPGALLVAVVLLLGWRKHHRG